MKTCERLVSKWIHFHCCTISFQQKFTTVPIFSVPNINRNHTERNVFHLPSFTYPCYIKEQCTRRRIKNNMPIFPRILSANSSDVPSMIKTSTRKIYFRSRAACFPPIVKDIRPGQFFRYNTAPVSIGFPFLFNS